MKKNEILLNNSKNYKLQSKHIMSNFEETIVEKGRNAEFCSVEEMKNDLNLFDLHHRDRILFNIQKAISLKIHNTFHQSLTNEERLFREKLRANLELCRLVKSQEKYNERSLEELSLIARLMARLRINPETPNIEPTRRQQVSENKTRTVLLNRKTLPISEKDAIQCCDICMEDVSVRNFVKLGCQHEFCSSCAEKIDKCAICREPIESLEVSLCEYE